MKSSVFRPDFLLLSWLGDGAVLTGVVVMFSLFGAMSQDGSKIDCGNLAGSMGCASPRETCANRPCAAPPLQWRCGSAHREQEDTTTEVAVPRTERTGC